LRTFAYSPQGAGSWELVSFGEEGDFYLVFLVSSLTKEGLANTLDAYKRYINQYKSDP
jgi:hypothetical protein